MNMSYCRFYNTVIDLRDCLDTLRYRGSEEPLSTEEFVACNTSGTPVVISESVNGVSGCLYELFQNIKKFDVVKTYHENDFKEWLSENYNIYLAYDDGMVLMFERDDENKK